MALVGWARGAAGAVLGAGGGEVAPVPLPVAAGVLLPPLEGAVDPASVWVPPLTVDGGGAVADR
jgi:hypothetical protein